MTTMTLHEAGTRLAHLRAQVRAGIRIEAAGAALLALAAYALSTWAIDRHLRLEWPFRLVLLAGFAWLLFRLLRGHLLRPLAAQLDDEELALAVERRGPELQQALISGLQFDRVLGSGEALVESRQLMTAVVEDVRGRLATLPFGAVVDAARVRRFGAAGLACAFGFAIWGALDASSLGIWASRNLLLANVDWPRYTQLEFADTANVVRMAQGDALTVRVVARGTVPDQVFLYSRYDGGESGVEPMSSTGEGEFTLTLPAVLEGGQLWAEGGDGVSAPLKIAVVERPRIADVQVRMVFPDYMAKDPELVPPTEGELRVVRGSRIELQGRSHKPIDEAFLLFGSEEKVALEKDADGHTFRGVFLPKASGLLVLDVIDQDRFQAGTPPKLLLRIVDDRPPTIDFKMRGIGSLITVHARIPGDLKIKDDFGLREVAAGLRAVADNAEPAKPKEPADAAAPGEPAEPKPEPKPAEVPFAKIEVIYADPLVPGAVRYETTAGIDLKQIAPDPDQNSEKNKVRPGMLLSVRFQAKDNFGPGDPHEAFGETLTFRVVTRDKLLEELRRRQVEQRQELQRILDEEKAALVEVKEMLNPTAADERSQRARAELKRLARQQQALGRRVAFVGEMYQRILWEFENNRLIEPVKVREIEGLICAPLADLAKEAFPVTARQVDEFSANGSEDVRSTAVTGYTEIIRRIAAVIEVMEQAESLAALIEELRGIIKIEDTAIQDAERRLREAGQNVFRPKDGNKQPGNK